MTISAPEPTVLADGLGLGESPRWHEGRLWFSDWVDQTVQALDPEGGPEVITKVASMPFSIDWLPGGPMLITSGSRVLRMDPDGSLDTHVDLGHLSDYGWNEIVVDGRGNAYVNCAGFDLMAGEEPAPGMIALITPDREVRQVADGVMFPNGMAVTPDGSTLIVAESYASRLSAFDIATDGSLSDRRVWADVAGPPDGICIDVEGAVWYADVPNERCVRVHEGGEVLGTFEADRGCFACMLGGEDGATLFVNAANWTGTEGIGNGPRMGQMLAVEAPAPHAGWP
jgi:sugar lactone lactonase YvrE